MAHLGLVGSCSVLPALNWVPTSTRVFGLVSCAAGEVVSVLIHFFFSALQVADAGVAYDAGTEWASQSVQLGCNSRLHRNLGLALALRRGWLSQFVPDHACRGAQVTSLPTASRTSTLRCVCPNRVALVHGRGNALLVDPSQQQISLSLSHAKNAAPTRPSRG